MGFGSLRLWGIWLAATLVASGALAAVMFVGGPRNLLVIGETTGVHHQMEMACESCHTAEAFATEKAANKAMTKACLECHDAELEVSNDSHPVKKFRDPRNVQRLEKLNALYCQTCHVEHKPEITREAGVTLPTDFCVACHEDIGEERPQTHQDLEFATCATAGCHNYHDNTALYEKFLLTHAEAPEFAEHAVMAYAAQARGPKPVQVALSSADPAGELEAYLAGLEDPPEDPAAQAQETLDLVLTAVDAEAPEEHMDPDYIEAWAGSGHALAGINCAGCHMPEPDEEAAEPVWIAAPGREACAECHKPQNKTFLEGRHGMSAHPKLAKPRDADEGVAELVAYLFRDQEIEPITVGQSPLPMKEDAHHLQIGTCNACHTPHEVDLEEAAVEACASCHDDTHTQNYFNSPHYALWFAEMSGEGAPGSGVSCADCHMPKIEYRRDGFITTHNQNAYLRPNEKMIRPTCMSCHSLGFSIDALADPDLVESNFNGRPETQIPSIDWALSREGGEK